MRLNSNKFHSAQLYKWMTKIILQTEKHFNAAKTIRFLNRISFKGIKEGGGSKDIENMMDRDKARGE